MRLQTSVIGNDGNHYLHYILPQPYYYYILLGDLFVGGSFESRVWNGSQFVNVYNVAHFKGKYILCCSIDYYYFLYL